MPAAEVAQPHDVSPKKADSPLFRMSFPEVLEDLLSRFILNLPACELGSMERIYFQCEQACVPTLHETLRRQTPLTLYPTVGIGSMKTFSRLTTRVSHT